MAYLHGVQTKEKPTKKTIQLKSTTVIGIIGTSDIAIDAPIIIESVDDERVGTGTIKEAIALIQQQSHARIVVVSHDNDIDAAIAAMAQNNSGLTPNILITPNVADIAVAKKLEQLASDIGAVAIVESSGTDLNTHKAFAKQLSETYVIAGGVSFDSGSDGGSATVAGMIARVDREKGFHVSPSNKRAFMANGARDSIGYVLGRDCLANQLNEQGVGCFVVRDGKATLWGSRLASGRHIQQCRAEQFIKRAIEAQTIDMVDANINSGSVTCLLIRIQTFLDQLVAKGVIAGGDVSVSEHQADNAGQNKLSIDYTLGLFDSAEQITYSVSITNDYNKKIA